MPNSERYWTVADRDALPEDGNRYEVIDGVLLVIPAPRWPHQRASIELTRILADYLDAERVGSLLVAPADVVFSPVRVVQPDLFVTPLVDGHAPDSFEEVGRLLLAIEILSVSTARTDRRDKRGLFRQEGVGEYWVVDLDARAVERSVPTAWDVEARSDRVEWWPVGVSQPLEIDLPAVFSRVLDR